MAGLFFCLASAEGAGLFVLPCYNTTQYKRLQRVLYRPCSYTAHAAKQRSGLCRCISSYLSHSTAADTRPTQAAIMPPAQRWSVSQRRNTSSAYPEIPAPRRTLDSSAQPPYYNNVYKGASLLWIHASPAGSRCFPRLAAGDLAPVTGQQSGCTGSVWRPLPGGQSSGGGASGGAEPLTATAASLFGLSPDS